MSIKYDLPKDAASLNKIIEAAIKSASTMKLKVQQAGVAILHHAYQHGDYTKANDLIEGVGFGLKRDSLVAWFQQYGGLTIAEDKSGFDGWKGKEYIRNNFDQAKAVMWYDVKRGNVNPFAGYSLEDEVKKLVARHKQMIKKYDDMPAEDKEKVKLDVNEATIEQLLHLAHFDIIIEPEHTTKKLGRNKVESTTAPKASKAA